MQRSFCIPAVAVLAIAVSGCGYGKQGSIRPDMSIRNSGGTIAVSDPKLYSREALVTERSRDLAWLDRLIEESTDTSKVSFKPSLYREIELVTVLSASLGLRFDPAAAVTNRRADALGEIQQQYDELKLQVMLEQLRTDVALFRKKLAEQTEIATPGLGTPESAPAVGSVQAVNAPDVAPLMTAINSLSASLANRFNADVKPVGKADVTSTPIEDFQDRLAYRNMLKAARNAAAWDELHDAGNNRFIRLNFQATAFPVTGNERALGAIQVRIINGSASQRFLFDWLRWINTKQPWRADAGIRSTTIDPLLGTGQFLISKFPGGAAGAHSTDILLPVLVDRNGAKVFPDDLRIYGMWNRPEDEDRDYFETLLGEWSSEAGGAQLTQLCISGGATKLTAALATAQARERGLEVIRAVNLIYGDLNLPVPAPSISDKHRRALEFHRTILDELGRRPECLPLVEEYKIEASPVSWGALESGNLGLSNIVRIYEVGPREQVQQVSTLARSANSLALAASIAGSAPQAGVGADVSSGFRRDMMARASALDRVPEVVGYSVAGTSTFGWVIGPRATTDERGRAIVEQLLKPYDLSVDLSVPAWWSSLELEMVTAWAPSPRMLAEGSLTVAPDAKGGSEGPAKRKPPLLVPLPATADEFEDFSQLLLQDGRRPVAITGIEGGPVNACAATTLIVRGRNLWRADRAVLLGTTLGKEAISIMPDMAGILLTVPAIPAIPGEQAFKQDPNLHVFTPLDRVKVPVTYSSSPSGDACKPKPATDTTAPTTTGVDPSAIAVPSKVSLDVRGTNLAGVASIKLGRQPGEITARGKDGKSLTALFDQNATSGLETGTVKLEFFDKDGKSVGTALDVRISRSGR